MHSAQLFIREQTDWSQAEALIRDWSCHVPRLAKHGPVLPKFLHLEDFSCLPRFTVLLGEVMTSEPNTSPLRRQVNYVTEHLACRSGVVNVLNTWPLERFLRSPRWRGAIPGTDGPAHHWQHVVQHSLAQCVFERRCHNVIEDNVTSFGEYPSLKYRSLPLRGWALHQLSIFLILSRNHSAQHKHQHSDNSVHVEGCALFIYFPDAYKRAKSYVKIGTNNAVPEG